MSKETEQDEKPPKCKHCEEAVYLYTSGELELSGGDPNEEYPESVQTEITIFAHVCSVCYQTQDAGIEHPRYLDTARQEAWQEAKLLIRQLLTGTLPPEFTHDWDGIIHHEGLTASICTKCGLISDRPRFAFKVGGKLEYIAAGVAPPCSGKKNLAWWDSEAEAETSG